MAKYVTEFIGTFFLVLTIGLTATHGIAMAPLAIGSILMVMVYMGGHISGAHYNPAVSVALLMRGAMPSKDLLPYWISQIGGAIVAACLVAVINPAELTEAEPAVARFFGPQPGVGYGLGSPGVWLIEILFTFALTLVILNVATSRSCSPNQYFGLAIGFVVMVGAFAGGHISGGAFNPAVGIGPNLVRGTWGGTPDALQNIVLHTLGPLIGSVLAAVIFRIQEDSVVSNPKP